MVDYMTVEQISGCLGLGWGGPQESLYGVRAL